MTIEIQESNDNKDSIFEPISVHPKFLSGGYNQERARKDFFTTYLGYRNPAAVTNEITPQRRTSIDNDFVPYALTDSVLYDLLDEMHERDEVIGGTEELITAQICGMKLQLGLVDAKDEKQQEVTKFVRENLLELSGHFGFENFKHNTIKLSRRHGFSVFEILYKRENGKIVFAGFHHRHPGMFEFDEMGNLYLYSTSTNIVSPYNLVKTNRELKRVGVESRNRFFVHRMPAPYGNPYGESALYPLRFAYYFKKHAKISWASNIDVNGVPFLVGTVKQGMGGLTGSDDARQKFIQAMESAREDVAILLPEGIDIKSIDRGIQGKDSPQEQWIDYLDQYIQARLLGAQLTTGGAEKGNGFAAARVNKRVAQEILVSTTRAFVESVQRQLINPLVRMNFGDIDPPKLLCNFEGQPDQDEIVKKYQAAQTLGLVVSREKAYLELQITPPKDEEDELLPAVTPGMFVPANGEGGAVGTPPKNLTDPSVEDEGNSRYLKDTEDLESAAIAQQFAFENEEWEQVYSNWKSAVNLSAAQLKSWGESPVSRMASLSPGAVIARNLKLLETPKDQWGRSEISAAKRTISFIARMSKAGDGKDVRVDIPFSKQEISLLNWAHRPGTVSPAKLSAWSGEAGKRKVEAINKGEKFEMPSLVEKFNFEAIDRFRFVDLLDKVAAHERDLAKNAAIIALRNWENNIRQNNAYRLNAPLSLQFIQNNLPQLPRTYSNSASDIAAGIVAMSVVSMNASPASNMPREISANIDDYSEGLNYLVKNNLITDEEKDFAEELLLLLAIEVHDRLRVYTSDLAFRLSVAPTKFDSKFLLDAALPIIRAGGTLEEYINKVIPSGDNIPKDLANYYDMVFRGEASSVFHAARNYMSKTEDYVMQIWGKRYFNPDDERSRPTHALVNQLLVKLNSDADRAFVGGPPWAYNCRCTFEFLPEGQGYAENPNALSIALNLERFDSPLNAATFILDKSPALEFSLVQRIRNLFSDLSTERYHIISTGTHEEFATVDDSLCTIVPSGSGACIIECGDKKASFSFDEERGHIVHEDSIGMCFSTCGVTLPCGKYKIINETFPSMTVFDTHRT
jgi:hypothetical protein